jgi:hypothetical protein
VSVVMAGGAPHPSIVAGEGETPSGNSLNAIDGGADW